jgi:hypothetical protein
MKPFHIPDQFKGYYSASTKPEIVEIDEMHYLSLLGTGSPGTAIFYQKKKAITEFVAQLQLQVKGTEKEFESNIVEIFYWFDQKHGFVDIGDFYTTLDLSLLQYRMAILLPEFVTAEDIKNTIKNKSDIPFATQFERFAYAAGKCVQVMHLGPFADELETLPVLQDFADRYKLVRSGMHHEIHLTHFEQGQSQNHLKTILRDPVQSI